MKPRVSILIPNFNNGRESSKGGCIDILGQLLQSLWDTLKDEATPFEVIAYDDGSTDDSLQTLREWCGKQWPNGEKFLELIEERHCGVLSITANVLSRRARGDIFVRLDGDIICLTPNWVSKLCDVFDHGPPRLGVVGPKQLTPNGHIHSFGDWVLHPRGYHHIAAGFPRDAVRFPMEVDHVMGCFYCCKKEVFEELEGYDENFLRGQTVDFGLRARLAGWSCFALPHIEFIHQHCNRENRSTGADTLGGVKKSLSVFREKWGFDRIAPDLDVVRERYAGTPLLWNARFFGGGSDELMLNATSMDVHATQAEPLKPDETEWVRYTKDATFKSAIDYRANVAVEVARQTAVKAPIVVVGCDCGLTAHLLATTGANVIGIDIRANSIDFAAKAVKNQTYPDSCGGQPRFLHQTDPKRFPLNDGEAGFVLMFDQMEHHPNPVGLLNEAHRVLTDEGMVAIVSESRTNRFESPLESSHPYSLQELLTQVNGHAKFLIVNDLDAIQKNAPLTLVLQRIKELNPDNIIQKHDDPPRRAVA